MVKTNRSYIHIQNVYFGYICIKIYINSVMLLLPGNQYGRLQKIQTCYIIDVLILGNFTIAVIKKFS